MDKPTATDGEAPANHDAACDQCRAKKIRCNRQHPRCLQCHHSRLDCSWTNKGKKPNQTKKLAADFERLGSRLSNLEKKVDQVLDSLLELPLRMGGGTNEPSHVPVPRGPMSSSSELQQSEKPTYNASKRTGDCQAGNIIDGPRGEQRHHGPSSLLSLLLQSDAVIDANLREKNSLKNLLLHPLPENQDMDEAPPLETFFQYKDRVHRELSRDLALHSQMPDVSGDQLPPVLPPRNLLEGLFDGYFRHIDPVTPLLTRSRVEDAVIQCYDSQPMEPDIGWVIIFNYIIIRSLSGRHILEQPLTDVHVVSGGSQFDQPFVQNLERALSFLDQLKKPTLTNVQALGALVIVAQRYFSFYTAQSLLNQTCHLAKSIGLHQHRPQDDQSSEEFRGRSLTFWLLFTLDKDISLLLGSTPNLPMYDCEVPLPGGISSDQQQRIEACIIEERIYIELYSASGCRKTQEETECAVSELEATLDRFHAFQSNLDPEDPMSGWRGKPFLELEMKFIYHQLRVMVLRCSKKPEKKNRCMDESRKCITYISSLRVARTTIGGSMVLRRPFQWHSFTPFFEIFSSLFHYPPAQTQLADLELLRKCASILREVASFDSPVTLCAVLLRIFTACIDIAEAFIQHCHGHQPVGDNFHETRTSEKRTYTGISGGVDSGYEESQRARMKTRHQQQPESDASIEVAGFDPFFGTFDGTMDEIVQVSDDLMWGGDDILQAIQRQEPYAPPRQYY